PYLEGQRCDDCGAIFLGERSTCSNCGAREKIKPHKLANTGVLYVYSIVHRSFPGVEVPFVSAVVDLDNGGTVKGNLINIEPTPEKIRMGMPVEVVYQVAPAKDREGNEYLSYYFQPREK
ncbi:MAG: OB-fold domain-containing protein, partial [Myxococcota bacterium]